MEPRDHEVGRLLHEFECSPLQAQCAAQLPYTSHQSHRVDSLCFTAQHQCTTCTRGTPKRPRRAPATLQKHQNSMCWLDHCPTILLLPMAWVHSGSGGVRSHPDPPPRSSPRPLLAIRQGTAEKARGTQTADDIANLAHVSESCVPLSVGSAAMQHLINVHFTCPNLKSIAVCPLLVAELLPSAVAPPPPRPSKRCCTGVVCGFQTETARML